MSISWRSLICLPLLATDNAGLHADWNRKGHKRRNELGAEALRFFKAKVRQFEDVFAAQFPVTRLKAVVTESRRWL